MLKQKKNKSHTNVVGKMVFLNRDTKSAVSLDNLCLKENGVGGGVKDNVAVWCPKK